MYLLDCASSYWTYVTEYAREIKLNVKGTDSNFREEWVSIKEEEKWGVAREEQWEVAKWEEKKMGELQRGKRRTGGSCKKGR